MKAEVFDDWKSFVHCLTGGLSYFFPLSLSYSYSTKLQSTLSSVNLSSSHEGIYLSSASDIRWWDYAGSVA
jgi:hypothetical protein